MGRASRLPPGSAVTLALAHALVLAPGCGRSVRSAPGGDGLDPTTAGGSGDTTDSGGVGGSSVGGGSGGAGGSITIAGTGGNADGGFAGNTPCTGALTALAPPPLDLYVLLDGSSALVTTSASGAMNEWGQLVSALEAYFVARTGTTTSVALGYYPTIGTDGAVCDEASYAAPSVDFAALREGAATLVASLEARIPRGDPTARVALVGALAHAQAWSPAHPDHTVAVLWVTGSVPTYCSGEAPPDGAVPSELGVMQAVARDGFAPADPRTPSIRTFVLPVFALSDAPIGSYDDVAAAGGSRKSYLLGAPDLLSDVIDAIQADAVACEFSVVDESGQKLDLNRLNLLLERPEGATLLPYVGLGGCDPTFGGWHADVELPAEPASRIILCPATCDALRADSGTDLRATVGCRAQTD